MVLEYSTNGDLLDYIINNYPHYLSENKAALLISQYLEAVHYLHLNRIVHRDIKPENFLLFEEDFNVKLKLIDFGFATKIDKELHDKLGSIPYMAPEIFLNDTYDEKVDLWACGIIMYNMLTGSQPFFADFKGDLISKIMNFNIISFDNDL